MSLGKKLFIGSSAAGVCLTDLVNPFTNSALPYTGVALYQLDGNANDTVGSHNGTATNVTYSTGKFGNAAVFNGSSSYIQTTLSPSFGAISHSLWFYADNADSTNFLYYFDNRGGRIDVAITGTGSNSISASFEAVSITATTATSQFNHLSLVYTGWASSYSSGSYGGAITVTAYLNGSPIGTANPTPYGQTTGMRIGRSGGSYYFDGKIDQVRIYEKEISSDEVGVLYNETASTASNTDVLNEGSGIALYSLDYDASDAGGNYNGTPSNVTFGVDGQINYGASFNGSNSYITLPSALSDGVTTDATCISFWFNVGAEVTSSTTNNEIMQFAGTSSLTGKIALGSTSGHMSGETFSVTSNVSGTYTYSQTNIPAGWNHAVVQWNSSDVKWDIYINAVKHTTYTVGTQAQRKFKLKFGNRSTAYFTGKLDQIRIFNKALSSSEVSTLYGETACVYTSTTDNNDYPVTNAAYYKLDNNAEDAKGSYDGTESNITYEFGRFGQAAKFNGTNSSIDIGTISQLPSNTNNEVNFTFSVWVKSNTTDLNAGGGSNPIFVNYNNSYQFLGFGGNDNSNFPTGRIFYYTYGGSGQHNNWIITDETFDDDNWHHVVVTDVYNSGTNNRTRTLYVDNVQKKQDTVDKNFFANTVSTYLGSTNNAYSKQYLDQVRIFDSALDATAIESLYNEKPVVNTSNFETVLYNGTSSDRYVSNVGFQPDLVWIKRRNSANAAVIQDSARGENNYLMPSSTNAQASNASFDSFEANGFELTGSGGSWNNSAGTYVAWCWKGGGDAVNNTDGNITSQVSANQDAGFSIVKWTSTGSGASAKTVGHGLSSTPEMIILKNASATAAWRVYHSGIPSPNNSLALSSAEIAFSFWPSVSSTNFGLVASVTTGESSGASGQSIIAYCFHSVAGYQKVGGYTGGGSSGKTVTTGFRPSWVMIKRTDVSNYWVIIDSKRDITDPYSKILWANVSDIEADGGTATAISFSDTGFSMSTSAVGSSINASGGTYIYLAIA